MVASRASATIESLSHHREPQPPSRAFRQAQCGTSGNGFSSNYENGITNRLNGG